MTAYKDEWQKLNDEVELLSQQKLYDRAIKVAKQAFRVAKNEVGPNHPDVAASMRRVALLYGAKRDFIQAEILLLQSLEIEQNVFGQSHPNVVKTLYEMAAFYKKYRKKERERETLEYIQLIQAGNVIGKGEAYGVTYPFHALAQHGSVEGLKNLLEPLNSEARSAMLNSRDHRGFTVLHKAMEKGDLATVSYLLENSADINARVIGTDPEGWTALHLAAFDNHPDIIELLFKHNADLEPVGTGFGRMTPLKVAITKEHVESALKLIELGANVHNKDENDFTLLHEACNIGSVEIAEALLAHGAAVDGVARDHSTPLCWAARNNSVVLVNLLLKHGANASHSGPNGETPLIAAKMSGAFEAAELLVKAGAE